MLRFFIVGIGIFKDLVSSTGYFRWMKVVVFEILLCLVLWEILSFGDVFSFWGEIVGGIKVFVYFDFVF